MNPVVAGLLKIWLFARDKGIWIIGIGLLTFSSALLEMYRLATGASEHSLLTGFLIVGESLAATFANSFGRMSEGLTGIHGYLVDPSLTGIASLGFAVYLVVSGLVAVYIWMQIKPYVKNRFFDSGYDMWDHVEWFLVLLMLVVIYEGWQNPVEFYESLRLLLDTIAQSGTELIGSDGNVSQANTSGISNALNEVDAS